MSIDVLQEKIRKRKSGLLLDLTLFPHELPEGEGKEEERYASFCRSLLAELKGSIPALRFRLSAFALWGPKMLGLLPELTKEAAALGYYVLLDAPEADSAELAAFGAAGLLGPDSPYASDGVVRPMYAGNDVLQQYLPYCKKGNKDVFALCRTANKSASELQDLLSGSRLAHMAIADQVARCAAPLMGKYGYACLGLTAAAGQSSSIKTLRTKYPGLFLLVDGVDLPGGNMKNVSLAFDKLGRGAVYCSGRAVTCAWRQAEGMSAVDAAVAEVERQKNALQRYVTFL